MCWLDRKAIEQILKIRDKFGISTFVETGTFKGVNARFHAGNFEEVLSCDISEKYLAAARERMAGLDNVHLHKQSSPDFLRSFIKQYEKEERTDTVFMYLDAHFYDPDLPEEEKWVILSELKALKGFKNCVIAIHDFDNGLGHCVYDGEHLGLPLIRKDLLAVNPQFALYTNELSGCDIIESPRGVAGLVDDAETRDNISYAHSTPRLTYRGLLYCTPKELNLDEFELRQVD